MIGSDVPGKSFPSSWTLYRITVTLYPAVLNLWKKWRGKLKQEISNLDKWIWTFSYVKSHNRCRLIFNRLTFTVSNVTMYLFEYTFILAFGWWKNILSKTLLCLSRKVEGLVVHTTKNDGEVNSVSIVTIELIFSSFNIPKTGEFSIFKNCLWCFRSHKSEYLIRTFHKAMLYNLTKGLFPRDRTKQLLHEISIKVAVKSF